MVFVKPEQGVMGFAHLWMEMVAHILDDKETPFVEVGYDRVIRDQSLVCGLRHREKGWVMVAVNEFALQRYIEDRSGKDATIIASVYEAYRNAFIDVLAADREIWPGYDRWIENFEYNCGIRRDRPLFEQRRKGRRIRIRRGD